MQEIDLLMEFETHPWIMLQPRCDELVPTDL